MGFKIITHTARLFISTRRAERLTDLIWIFSTSKISIDELMSKPQCLEISEAKPEIKPEVKTENQPKLLQLITLSNKFI